MDSHAAMVFVVQCVVVCAREVEVVVAMQVEQFFVGVQDTSE